MRSLDSVSPLRYTAPSKLGRAAQPLGDHVMKPNIHPAYHEINVVMTDGTQFTTRSTYGKPGDIVRLDIDPKTHPAWTGQHREIKSGGQVSKFNKRFANLGAKKDAPAAATATPEKKAEKA
jgi:large subunit ribosomal protein L31